MYTLQSETDIRRSYRSSISDTEIFTNVIYTDGNGSKWWAFEDLLQIPFIRKKAAEKVSQLYGVGLTKEDLTGFTARLKTLLKSDDIEKYEKAYSEVLNMEAVTEETTDPVKQSLSLCSVYILSDNERVDTFSFQDAIEKMNTWAMDMDAQAFFLNFLTSGMNDFTKHYKSIMQIASTLQK